MLHTLSTLSQHPESVPINALLAVEGTPLEKQEVRPKKIKNVAYGWVLKRWSNNACKILQPVSIFEMIRMIATARIVMPKSMVRLSAGRVRFSQSEQAMCFLAGANSIFTGDKLLTTPNNEFTDDQKMFELLGKLSGCARIMDWSGNTTSILNQLTLSVLFISFYFQALYPSPRTLSKGQTSLNSQTTIMASRSRLNYLPAHRMFMSSLLSFCFSNIKISVLSLGTQVLHIVITPQLAIHRKILARYL